MWAEKWTIMQEASNNKLQKDITTWNHPAILIVFMVGTNLLICFLGEGTTIGNSSLTTWEYDSNQYIR